MIVIEFRTIHFDTFSHPHIMIIVFSHIKLSVFRELYKLIELQAAIFWIFSLLSLNGKQSRENLDFLCNLLKLAFLPLEPFISPAPPNELFA